MSGSAVAAMTIPFLVRTDVSSNLNQARKALADAANELSRLLGHVAEQGHLDSVQM
jgi:hypothetical protein